MKSRMLLLGIGAVLALAGGARAGCDSYGPGYASAPGSNTCIKIGGSLQADVLVGGLKRLDGSGGEPTGEEPGQSFRTQADVNVTTKSMTDWGPLTTFTGVRSRRLQ